MTADDLGATVNEWVNVLRRARLGPNVKLVAFVLASYADPDGTRIFPGVARVAVDCGLDYRTVRRALAALRSAGLVETTARGARRAGRSDTLRLIFAEDLMERCDVLSPAAERTAIEKLSARERTRSTGHKRPVEAASSRDDHGSRVTHENGSTGQGASVLQVTGDPPPSIRPLPYTDPPYAEADDRCPRTGNAPARDSDDSTPSSPSPDTRTRRGTAEAARAQADRLNEWERAQSRPPDGHASGDATSFDAALEAMNEWKRKHPESQIFNSLRPPPEMRGGRRSPELLSLAAS